MNQKGASWSNGLCLHLGCSGGVVVVPVQFVLVRTWSARQQNINVEIVVWFFSSSPVFSYCLVDNYGSLDGWGRNKETVTLKRSSEYGLKSKKRKEFQRYLSWSVATAHLLLFIQPPDDQSGIFEQLEECPMLNRLTQDYILTKIT